ncbi:FISUMP domain-containing protein [Fibrobacter succinogenes]|uniref:FISUMP domain-containing protein n=1 Tax=Fibrobacter succinogenes TaxID=833 RepID=UPI001569FCD0|nr:FISUMP domain-containing protein [Fibrobacter succinogenes]
MKVMKFISNFAMLAFGLVFWACTENNTAGTSDESEGIVAIKDREIAGVTQKGPFLTGSSLTVQELDGETLAQTGKSFRTRVKSDQGDFVLGGINLVSPYALLEVNGYYLNEVSWKKSEGMIALNALTDLSDRSHVNVNILTHLTVDRVLTLVRRDGKSFAEAKKQAEREVLKSFGFTGVIESSEDLNLFEEGNGLVLLTISVLMQGERAEAEFSELLAKAAIAFADSGVWNGPEKAEVADWAFLTEKEYWDAGHGATRPLITEIKKNVESWNVDPLKREYYADSTLEVYMYDFWVKEYGLGECSDENVGEIRNNADEHSKFYNMKFKCDGGYHKHWIWMGVADFSDSDSSRIVDLQEQKTYKMKRFGDTFWMISNLQYGPKPFKSVYLYKYESASKICPVGSRLPRYDEVENLLLQYGGAGKSAADSLMAVDGFNALQDGPFSIDFWWYDKNGHRQEYEQKGVAIWISTTDIYSYENFVLWIDSAGAEIKKITDYFSGASVRCVVSPESDKKQDAREQKQYSADSYIKDVRDDEVYRFTEIDGKYWLAENLRYREPVLDTSMCDDDGCRYSWLEAVASDSAYNVCPEGWRLPSRFDWDEMLTFVANGVVKGSTYDIGYRLCDYREWDKGDHILQGENDPYDFSVKYNAEHIFWTKSDTTVKERYGDEYIESAWVIEMRDKEAGLILERKQDRYLAVRCVKDK